MLRPEHLLIAEHGHDFRDDLAGGGWHGTMNYAGFLRPAWEWLRGDELPEELRHHFWGTPVGLPRLGGQAVTTTMRIFRAGVPWQSILHSWNLLDSHDTARFRSVAGSRELQEVGIGIQMTLPGVPMVFAGDELGLEGFWGEDARRTMPWDTPESWDAELFASYTRLIAFRRSSDALARGGLRRSRSARTRSSICGSPVTSASSALRREPSTSPCRCRSQRSAAARSRPCSAVTQLAPPGSRRCQAMARRSTSGSWIADVGAALVRGTPANSHYDSLIESVPGPASSTRLPPSLRLEASKSTPGGKRMTSFKMIVAAALVALLVPVAAVAKDANVSGPAKLVGKGFFGGEFTMAATENQRPVRIAARAGYVGILDLGGDLKVRCTGKGRVTRKTTEQGTVYLCAGPAAWLSFSAVTSRSGARRRRTTS